MKSASVLASRIVAPIIGVLPRSYVTWLLGKVADAIRMGLRYLPQGRQFVQWLVHLLRGVLGYVPVFGLAM